MAAGIEALLRTEGRYDVDRVTTGEELDALDAEIVVADSGFLLAHGGPTSVPTIVLMEASADRARVARRAPSARDWLASTATGAQLIAAIDASALPPVEAHPAPRPATPARPVARAAPVAAVEALNAPAPRESAGLLALGVTAAGLALSFLWLAVRP